MENEFRKLKCLHCGREIQVPMELESFNCVYCGEKLSLQTYLQAEAANSDETDLEYVREHLYDCIECYPNYFQHFNRKNYDPSFQKYEAGVENVFRAMDRYVCANPLRREALLDELVSLFLSKWAANHPSDRPGKCSRRSFNDKMTLALYTVPAILHLELTCGQEFAEKLQQRFSAAYPDNIFHVASYSDIAGGFRKRGFCFITTAVCSFEGKPDDCAELAAFRAFRDGWLSETASGRALIEEYYELAPAVVSAIDCCDDSPARYAEIRREYLEPCYSALKSGEYELCRRIYVKMVLALKNRYGIRSDHRQSCDWIKS